MDRNGEEIWERGEGKERRERDKEESETE